MSSSAVAMGRVAFAALIIGAAPAFAQQAQPSSEPGVVVVQPARVPVPGSPQAAERNANLRPPPPGPIESRLLPIPESGLGAPRDSRSEPPAAASAAPPAVSYPAGRPTLRFRGRSSRPLRCNAGAVRPRRGGEPARRARALGTRGTSGRHRLRRPVGEPDRGHAGGARSARQAPRRAEGAPDRGARLCHRRRDRQPQGGAGARAGRAGVPDRTPASRRASRSAALPAKATTSRSWPRGLERRRVRDALVHAEHAKLGDVSSRPGNQG